jgi:hypothetical protein
MMAAARRARAPVAPVDGEPLAVLVQCEHIICALPATAVRRLLLLDEATVTAAPAGTRVAVAEGKRHAAWDLGELLGLSVRASAWVLLDVAGVPVALATGPCLAVRRLPRGVPLPGHIFRTRQGALPSAFPPELAPARGDVALGLWIEPAALCTAAELAAASDAVRARGAP